MVVPAAPGPGYVWQPGDWSLQGGAWVWVPSHNHRLLHRNLDERFIAHLTRRYILTITLYFIAFLVSIWHGLAGLTLCVGLTIVYLLPSRKPVFRQGTLEETG